MVALTAEQIFGSNDGDLLKVDCPEWGGHIFLRVMDGEQREEIELVLLSEDKKKLQTAKQLVLLYSVCDDKGKPIFTNENIASLKKRNAKVVERVYAKAIAHNKMRQKDIDELEGN